MSPRNDTSEAFDIKEFLQQLLSYKFLYIVCFLICLVGAVLINKISPLVYEVNSVIGPVEDRRSSLLGSDELFGGIAAYSPHSNLENDINSLNSFSLVAATINKLNLEVG